MIQAKLEFNSDSFDNVLAAFLGLPDGLRPDRYSSNENARGRPISDREKFFAFVDNETLGFFLKGQNIIYDLHRGKPSILCNSFMDVEPRLMEQFLISMASENPYFGYACATEELYYRNRIITVLNKKTTAESWVGRNINRYLPGLYWLTLLPQWLADKHHIPVEKLHEAALEHIHLPGHQNLFKFYDRPENWEHHKDRIDQLCRSIPGIFDVKKPRHLTEGVRNVRELDNALKDWP